MRCREGMVVGVVALALVAFVLGWVTMGYMVYRDHGRLVKVERLAAMNREYLDWLGDRNVEQWKFNQKVIKQMRKDGRWEK